MNKGMISNFVEADNYLINKFDTYSLALSFKMDPDIIETWSEEKISWAKTTLKINNQMEGGK